MGEGRSAGIYVLARQTRALDSLDAEFQDYSKLRSISWLLRHGISSTQGVVLKSCSDQIIETAVEFAQRRGWQKFMLRHDSPAGRPRTIQGGFLIGIAEIKEWAERFTSGGICMLLEPFDAIRNGYNFACMFNENSGIVEIVGPGFDASDLQRGQTTPHERVEISFRDSIVKRLSKCNQQEYRESVAERERKVWWKFIRRVKRTPDLGPLVKVWSDLLCRNRWSDQ